MTTPPAFDDNQTNITHGPLPFGDTDSQSTTSQSTNPFDLPVSNPFRPNEEKKLQDTESNPFLNIPQPIATPQVDAVMPPLPEPDLPLNPDETLDASQPKSNKKVLAAGLLIAVVFVIGGVIALSSQLGIFSGDNRQRAYEPTGTGVTDAAGNQITAMAPTIVGIVGRVCGSDIGAGKVFLYNLQDKHVKLVNVDKGNTAFAGTININTPYFIFFRPDGSDKIFGYSDSNHQLAAFVETSTKQSQDLELCDTNTDIKSIPTDTFTLGD